MFFILCMWSCLKAYWKCNRFYPMKLELQSRLVICRPSISTCLSENLHFCRYQFTLVNLIGTISCIWVPQLTQSFIFFHSFFGIDESIYHKSYLWMPKIDIFSSLFYLLHSAAVLKIGHIISLSNLLLGLISWRKGLTF